MQSLKEIFQATLASQDFENFFSGVEFTLLDHKPFKIKITSCKRIERTKGYRFTKHSRRTLIEADNGITAYGYGEDDFELLALQKSIAEAV